MDMWPCKANERPLTVRPDGNIPSVSIIIPSRNRCASLQEALESLGHIEYPKDRYETLVVDDGSSDGTAEMLARLRQSSPYPLHYERLKAPCGPSAARNVGLQMGKGEIFVFTDDDCLFEPGWLSALVACFDSDKVGAVGGPDYALPEACLFARCVSYLFTSFAGTGGLRGGQLRLGRYYPKGCNMAVRRTAINKAGAFDESLAPGEEIELGHRIEKAGYEIRYAPTAYVWHKRNLTLKAYLRKMFQIGYTRVILAHMHGGLLQLGHMLPFLCVLTALLLSLLSLVLPGALKALLFLLGAYLLLLLFSGVHALLKIKDWRVLLAVPALLVLHHSVHGIGFLVAAVTHPPAFKRPRA